MLGSPGFRERFGETAFPQVTGDFSNLPRLSYAMR